MMSSHCAILQSSLVRGNDVIICYLENISRGLSDQEKEEMDGSEPHLFHF